MIRYDSLDTSNSFISCYRRTIILAFPAHVHRLLDQLGLFINRSLAVEVYREGRLSLGKAAELAGAKSKWEMLMLLTVRGVPMDYTADDAKKDLLTRESVLGR